MSRFACLIVALVLAGSADAQAAQGTAAQGTAAQGTAAQGTAPQGVEVSSLAAPDAFTTPGRETGLPKTLWRGASVKTARTVLPLLAAKTLSPAAAALARRVLATGAVGPQGAGFDPILAGARANALIAQGDPRAAAAILARAPGVDRSPELARAAAESALLAGDDARACMVAENLSSGRDETYWLRLRTYCQALAGHPDQAQLTFDLAQSQAKDVTFGRLMNAKLAGAGNPGPASLRNGLDYALSKSLGLDLTAAKPSPAVLAALTPDVPATFHLDPAGALPDVALLAEAIATRAPIREAVVQAMIEAAKATEPKARARGQAAAALALALTGPLSPDMRSEFAALTLPEGRAPVGRSLALDEAGDQKLAGEAALLALWICADAGPAGPAIGDRVRIVRALLAAGLDTDARGLAMEGLLALK